MVVGDELIYYIPENFFDTLQGLFFLLKALGWMILIYLIFNTIMLIINVNRYKELKSIKKDLEEVKKLVKKKK